jgi:four helix bundle protein
MKGESRIQNSEARMGGQPVPASLNSETRLPAKSFEQLIVWQKAHQFVLGIYHLTEGFPRREVFGLTSQLRRAAISIPANIAEGFKKRGRADKGRYLNIAQASLEECRYFLILARDLNYGDIAQLRLQLEEVSKLLESYSAKILASGF